MICHSHTDRTLTEAEYNERLAFMTTSLREDLAKASEKIRELEFRSCIAEWAVAGVLSRNLQLVFATSDQRQQSVDSASAIGRNAGIQFLRLAELEFKDHAKHAELMRKIPPHEIYSHTSEKFATDRCYWPRPFK